MSTVLLLVRINILIDYTRINPLAYFYDSVNYVEYISMYIQTKTVVNFAINQVATTDYCHGMMSFYDVETMLK